MSRADARDGKSRLDILLEGTCGHLSGKSKTAIALNRFSLQNAANTLAQYETTRDPIQMENDQEALSS